MTIKSIQDTRYRAAVEALREGRLALKMSQAALAKELGRSQQFVSKYESFERRLDVIEFVDVAKSLSIDWPSLLVRLAQ